MLQLGNLSGLIVLCLASSGAMLDAFESPRHLTLAPCGGDWQFIDESGTIRLKLDAQGAKHFHEGRAAIWQNRKWGFIDEAGAIVVPPKYDEVGPYSQGAAWACIGPARSKLCGFIDHQGKELTPFRYSEAWAAREGLMFGRHAEGIDALSPNGMVLTVLPSGCDPICFWEGYLSCRDGDRAIIRNLAGQEIAAPPLSSAGRFQDGWAAVRLAEKEGWTFVDKRGNVLPGPGFRWADDFSEGLAPVCTENGCGFIDRAGKFAIEPRFRTVQRFHRGRAAVTTSHYSGFIDRTGKMVVPDVLLEVYEDFSEAGLARVVIPPGYRNRNYVRTKPPPPDVMWEGYPLAYIDREGKVLWQCTPEDRKRARARTGK